MIRGVVLAACLPACFLIVVLVGLVYLKGKVVVWGFASVFFCLYVFYQWKFWDPHTRVQMSFDMENV